MHLYEVGIYNRFIREKVRTGDDVGKEEAKWEEVHYFDIEAENQEQAEKKIRLQYSKLQGFEVDYVKKYATS